MFVRRTVISIVGVTALALTASACNGSKESSSTPKGAAAEVALTATDSTCEPAKTELAAGKTTIEVTNKGGEVTEVYVYGDQAGKFTKVISEVENIGPGTSRDLDVELSPGTYELACKPGMKGDGIRTKINVAGGSSTGGSSVTSSAATSYDREIEVAATDAALVTTGPFQARKGEKIEFKLENKGTKTRELEILDPSGKVVAEADAAAGSVGEVVTELTAMGTWRLKAEGTGVTELETSVTVG